MDVENGLETEEMRRAHEALERHCIGVIMETYGRKVLEPQARKTLEILSWIDPKFAR